MIGFDGFIPKWFKDDLFDKIDEIPVAFGVDCGAIRYGKIMRIDHIAYRVKDRNKTAQFFIDAFGYKAASEFDLKFDDGSKARCIALEPPEKNSSLNDGKVPWASFDKDVGVSYHLAPEIFVSDGTDDSIVGKWVDSRGGVGGIHHIAYQVESVHDVVKEWKDKGYAEFSSDDVLTCPGLTQIFTKPSELTGVIYEFITRSSHGFCVDNVKDLMLSTKDH